VERVLHLLDELVMDDVAGTNNDNVVTVPVGGAVLLQIVDGKVSEVVSVTLDRLAHHMVSVGVVMAVLNSGGLEFLAVGSMLGGDLLLALLKLSGIECSVGNAVTEHIHNLTGVTLEAGDGEVGVLTVVVG